MVLQSLEVDRTSGYINFDEHNFEFKRYGFHKQDVAQDVREKEAVGKIIKAVRGWLKRMRARKMRRQEGYMSFAGIRKLNGRSIGFIFLADFDQREFTLSVKERAYGDKHSKTIVNMHQLSHQAIQRCQEEVRKDRDKLRFTLQGAGRLMFRLLETRGEDTIGRDRTVWTGWMMSPDREDILLQKLDKFKIEPDGDFKGEGGSKKKKTD